MCAYEKARARQSKFGACEGKTLKTRRGSNPRPTPITHTDADGTRHILYFNCNSRVAPPSPVRPWCESGASLARARVCKNVRKEALQLYLSHFRVQRCYLSRNEREGAVLRALSAVWGGVAPRGGARNALFFSGRWLRQMSRGTLAPKYVREHDHHPHSTSARPHR